MSYPPLPNDAGYTSPYFSQDIPVSSDEIYANYLQEEKIKNLVQQTSPDNQLEDIEWRIKGYRKNPLTMSWEKVDPKMPEPSPILVSKYVSYLSSLLNENTRFTNLSGTEINAIMKLVIEWLTDDLDSNSVEYEIGYNYSERTRIGQIILNETYICLKRSQNGMESRRIFNALKVTESLSEYPQQKKGFGDALKFWK